MQCVLESPAHLTSNGGLKGTNSISDETKVISDHSYVIFVVWNPLKTVDSSLINRISKQKFTAASQTKASLGYKKHAVDPKTRNKVFFCSKCLDGQLLFY